MNQIKQIFFLLILTLPIFCNKEIVEKDFVLIKQQDNLLPVGVPSLVLFTDKTVYAPGEYIGLGYNLCNNALNEIIILKNWYQHDQDIALQLFDPDGFPVRKLTYREPRSPTQDDFDTLAVNECQTEELYLNYPRYTLYDISKTGTYKLVARYSNAYNVHYSAQDGSVVEGPIAAWTGLVYSDTITFTIQ